MTAVVVSASLLAGCQWPRDVDGTLERVSGETLRVGVSEADPWVRLEGSEPSGVEVELVRRLARELDAAVEWVEGSTAELVEGLERGALDVAVAGFTADEPWTQKVTFTRPYLHTRTVVAVPPGSARVDSVEGVEVAVERNSEHMGLVLDEDGRPRVVDDPGTAKGPVVFENWRVADLALEASAVMLHQDERVMAVRMGENAWLTTVERFLMGHEQADIADLARDAA